MKLLCEALSCTLHRVGPRRGSVRRKLRPIALQAVIGQVNQVRNQRTDLGNEGGNATLVFWNVTEDDRTARGGPNERQGSSP